MGKGLQDKAYLGQQSIVQTLDEMGVFHISSQELGVFYTQGGEVGSSGRLELCLLVVRVETLSSLLSSVPALVPVSGEHTGLYEASVTGLCTPVARALCFDCLLLLWFVFPCAAGLLAGLCTVMICVWSWLLLPAAWPVTPRGVQVPPEV